VLESEEILDRPSQPLPFVEAGDGQGAELGEALAAAGEILAPARADMRLVSGGVAAVEHGPSEDRQSLGRTPAPRDGGPEGGAGIALDGQQRQ
jgi:hypothetical protein